MTIIPEFVERHVEEAALLYVQRCRLAKAHGICIRDLRRFDDRLAAHLDALSLDSHASWPLIRGALADSSPGAAFTATVRAIEDGDNGLDTAELDELLPRAVELTPEGTEIRAAFGWVEPGYLKGIVKRLLDADEPGRRELAIAACDLQGVVPPALSERHIRDPNPGILDRALRAAGNLGCQDALAACGAVARTNGPSAFWALRSAVLLGGRGTEPEALADTARTLGSEGDREYFLALQAMSAEAAHRTLQRLASESTSKRLLIRGSAAAGDPTYIPWLLRNMTVAETARIAGEAFGVIVGIDLREEQLSAPKPLDFRSGPNDDPDDADVEMDPDDGLPWPDPVKADGWWTANSERFRPGQRYFMGHAVTRGHCIDVLKTGDQPQRILAAQYLCLLEPGTPLFNTSAPAWRQQKQLAGMS